MLGQMIRNVVGSIYGRSVHLAKRRRFLKICIEINAF
jgi:hypothetical protein